MLLCFLILTIFMTGHATLIRSSSDRICPGVVVNFTCSTTSSYMRWTATLGRESIEEITFTSSSSQLLEKRVLGTNHIFVAILMHTSPDISSNLSVVADTELNGLNVECNSPSTGREAIVLSTITTPPSNTINLKVISIQNGTFYATVNLQWSCGLNHSICDQRLLDTEYVVTLSSGSNSHIWKTATKTNTSILLRIPYNINNTVSVMAVNCAGTGTPTEISGIIVVNCSTPPAAWNGMVLDPTYNDTTEGAVVYFHCNGDTQSSSSTPNNNRVAVAAVCGKNATWLPPQKSETSLINDTVECNLLSYQNNSQSFDDVEKAETIFQCERGSRKFTAVCVQDMDVNCTTLPGTMFANNCSCNSEKGSNFSVTLELLLGSATGGGFIIGAVIACLFIIVCYVVIQCLKLRKRVCQQKNTAIDVCDNVAYEAVKISNNTN